MLAGLALAKWQIYDALHAAEHGAQRVLTSGTLVALAVLCPVFGAFLMLFGHRASTWLRDGMQMKDWRSTVIAFAVALPCVLAWIWIQRELHRQGYR